MAELFARPALPHRWLVRGPSGAEKVGGQGFRRFFARGRFLRQTGRKVKKGEKKALPMTGGSGDSWTRTNDPIDVNDVLYRLSHATMSFSIAVIRSFSRTC